MAQIATVDCDEQRRFCTKYGSRSEPAIKVFPSDTSRRSILISSSLQHANPLVGKILSHLENYVKKINSGNWESFKASSIKDKKHIFLLFSSRSSISALLKSVSSVRLSGFNRFC